MTTTSGNNAGSIQLNTVSTSTTTTTANTFTVAETLYTFMRPKTVTFTAEGLKPNTQYYPFFDDVYVGQYCSSKDNPAINPDNATNRAAKKVGYVADADRVLKTNEVGSLIGNFYLPANTFPVGSHTFKLVDNIRTDVTSGATIADAIYGSAEALYEANGVLKQQQTQITQDVVVNIDNTIKLPTPVVVADPGTNTPTVTPPPVTVCETWFFDYAVVETAQKFFTVVTNTSTPPTTAKPSTGGTVQPGSVTYVSTKAISAKKFEHTFRYVETNASQTLRQEWVGPAVTNVATDLPSLINFRPSGLSSTATVTIKKQWTKGGTVACPVTFGLRSPRRVDPLAQSFFVDAEAYPNGMFVTSIGVYFRTVDQSTPVILELREMANGLPGSNILPGGTALVQGRAASSSPDATVATVFRFDQPVYLRPSTDYCFVLKSTSMGYNAWCSRIGEIDVTTGKVIDTQPFIGTLFKSENDVTWTPDQYEDVKFDLFKADFNITQPGTLIFRPQGTGTGDTAKYYSTSQTLPLSFISTTKGTKVVGINIPMHGLSNNDYILIDGIATPTPVDRYNNIRAANLNGKHQITVVDEDNITITVGGSYNASKTGNLTISDLRGMIDNIPAVMPTALPSQQAVPYIEDGNLSPSTAPATPAALTQPTPPTITSSNTFTVYTNLLVNEVMIDYIGTEVSQTAIVEKVSLATGTSTAGLETPYAFQSYVQIDRNGDFYSFEEPRLIATPQNEVLHASELGGQPSATVQIELLSTDKDVSPIIDLNAMSLTVRTYKIDNQSGELDALVDVEDFNDPTLNSEIVPGAGKAAAKYKSSINTMDEAYNNIALFVAGNCPSPAIFDVYIRTSTDASTHSDRNWVYIPYGTVFPNSTNGSVVNEWLYRYNAAEPFSVFDVKIVMRSTNNSVVPKIFGVRTIANHI